MNIKQDINYKTFIALCENYCIARDNYLFVMRSKYNRNPYGNANTAQAIGRRAKYQTLYDQTKIALENFTKENKKYKKIIKKLLTN